MHSEDSVVWITGATGGLGREVALLTAKQGARLVLSARSETALLTLAAECDAAGASSAQPLTFDIRSPEAISTAAETIRRQYGRIDGFVASAADVPVGNLESLNIADWEYGLQNKLLATVASLRAVLPVMREQRRGRVVVLSGIRGTEPSAQSLLAGAVNAALNNIVKALSRDFAAYDVAINAVSPSLVMTRRGEKLLEVESKQTGKPVETIRAEMVQLLPSGRFVEAPEIGVVICNLLFSLPESLTGQNIIVDGSESRGIH